MRASRSRACSLLLVGLALSCTGEPTEAVGRVMRLSFADDADAARRAGCFTVGSSAGAGFAKLAGRAGGIASFVEAQGPEGRVPWVLLAAARPYPDNEAETQLRFLEGLQLGTAHFGLRESAYRASDELGRPRNHFRPSPLTDGHWLDTSAPRFRFPAAVVLGGLELGLVLDEAGWSGRLYADELDLTASGVLSGYVTAARLRSEIDRFVATCHGGSGSAPCAMAAAAFGAPLHRDAIEQAVVEAAGGFDARLDADRPARCNGPDCNALSVCIRVDVEPVGWLTMNP